MTYLDVHHGSTFFLVHSVIREYELCAAGSLDFFSMLSS